MFLLGKIEESNDMNFGTLLSCTCWSFVLSDRELLFIERVEFEIELEGICIL